LPMDIGSRYLCSSRSLSFSVSQLVSLSAYFLFLLLAISIDFLRISN
jgi:hypothetical protein